jgi:hypothetical protein
MSHRTTFADVANAALANAETLLAEWLPDGRRRGREWLATNPTRADGKPGSFAINLQSGAWADFATPDKGGDLISLRAYLLGTARQVDAAADIAHRLGLAWGKSAGNAAKRPRPVKAPAPPPRATEPHIGAPRLPLEIIHLNMGAPAATWTYTDATGRPLWIACRFNHPDGGKDVLPLCWHGDSWRWKALAAPRPLYHLPELLANPGAPIVVCEGEKAADAAQQLFGGCTAVTTWAGGCHAHEQTDWRPLAGRTVILWPDNDEPGQAAMASIKHRLGALGAAVYLPELPADLPPKFDAADLPMNAQGQHRAFAILGL